MRTRTSIWLIVAAIVLLIVSVAAWIVLPHHREHWKVVDPTEPDATMVDRILVIERRTGFRIDERGLTMTYTVEIPQFKTQSPLGEKVFELLAEEHRQVIGKKDSVRWHEVWASLWKKPHHNEWESNTDFEIKTANPDLISLAAFTMRWTGKSSNSEYISRNFVWTDGHLVELKLDDLFEPDSGWFTKLSRDVEADLRQKNPTFVGMVLPFTPAKFAAFTISREGLRIELDSDEFPPEIFDNRSATVPWSQLRPHMKADSVVTRWVDEQVEASRPPDPESVSPR